MKIELELKTPTLPNFIKIKGVSHTIDIGALDEESFLKFQEQFSKDLKKHWLYRRENGNSEVDSSLVKIAEIVAYEFSSTVAKLRRKEDNFAMKDARKLFSMVASEQDHTRELIGEFLNIKHPAVTISIQKAQELMDIDKTMLDTYKRIKTKFR